MSTENEWLGGRDAVQVIVQRYLTGEMSEYAEHMIDELMALHPDAALTERIKQAVDDVLTNALKPGGVLHVACCGRWI